MANRFLAGQAIGQGWLWCLLPGRNQGQEEVLPQRGRLLKPGTEGLMCALQVDMSRMEPKEKEDAMGEVTIAA